MDKNVLARYEKIRRPFTKELVEGWFKQDMEDIDVFYGRCLKYILKPLEEKGFYFDGVERVSPLDFFDVIKGTQKAVKGTQKAVEATKNSFFGVKIKMYFIDPKTKIRTNFKEPHIFLPYTNEYGDVFVRGGLYSLQMVLSERGPSVDSVKDKTIFIRVLVNKAKITSEPFDVYKIRRVSVNNYSQIPVNIKIPASRFYSAKDDRRVKSNYVPTPLLAWYVFAKFGFDGTMKEYANCEYKINSREILIEECPQNEGWEIIENMNNIHPKCMFVDFPTTVEPAIAIRTYGDSEVNSISFQYASAFLFASAVMGGKFDIKRIDDTTYWKLLIGYSSINLSKNAGEESYLRQMDEHIASIEEYADPFTIERWKKTNIKVENTYELFNYMITHYTEIIKMDNPANLLHKELACKEFLLENLIRSANEFKFILRNKGKLRPVFIQRQLERNFTLFGIDRSIRNNNSILEQTGTDNPFIDYGLGIIRQTKSTVSRKQGEKKGEFDPNHPSVAIDASQLAVVSFQYSSGPHPAGDGTLTPRVRLINGKYIALHEDDKEMYDTAEKRLKFGD